MMRQLDYGWRMLATGGSFAAFGVGGLMLSLLVFPPLLLIRCPRLRAGRARWYIHKAFGFCMWTFQRLGLARFTVEGREHLDDCRDALVLANHPTLIDVVAMISLLPNASCVVKQALWKNPFLSGVVRAADYISNSRPECLIEDCAEDLKSGNPLIIFPEGTRTEPGRPMHFLRGASYIALHSRKPIVPMLIWCTPTTLSKREQWYQIPHRRFDLRVKILPRIGIDAWVAADDPPPIAARKLTQALLTYFTEQLEHHG